MVIIENTFFITHSTGLSISNIVQMEEWGRSAKVNEIWWSGWNAVYEAIKSGSCLIYLNREEDSKFWKKHGRNLWTAPSEIYMWIYLSNSQFNIFVCSERIIEFIVDSQWWDSWSKYPLMTNWYSEKFFCKIPRLG